MPLGMPVISDTYTGKGAANPDAGAGSFVAGGGAAYNTGPNGAYTRFSPATGYTPENWNSSTVSLFGPHGSGFDPSGMGANSFVGGGGGTFNMGNGQTVSDPATIALMNYLNSQYTSQLAGLNSQLSGYATDTSYQNRLLGLNQQNLQTTNALTLAKIANAEQRDVNLPRQDIAANRAYLAAQGDYLNALAAYLPQSAALNSQQQQNAYGRAQLDYDTGYRNSLSDAVARGSVNSQGLRDTQDELSRQLGLSRGSADINYGRQQIDLGKESAGLTRDKAGLARDQALLDTKNATLDSLAKDYGIDRMTAENALTTGLQKLGLDYETVIRKINDATGETKRQIEALWPMLQQQAMALAGQG